MPSPWIPARVRDKFVLRGRTLSDFVEQPKAQKWKTLAEILGLQEIDSLRLDLQTVRNQLEEEARRTTEEAERAEAALSGRLKAVDEENLLAAIQGECVAADLALPASLDEALDPNWSTVAVSSQTATRAIAASTLLADVKSSRLTRVTFGGVDEWNTHVASANTALSDRLRFMSAAGTLLRSQTDDGYCPLCGQAASRLSISTRVAAALEDLQSAAEAHEKAENALRVTIDSLAAHRRLLEDLRRQCVAAGISSLDDVPTSPYDAVSGGLLAGAPIRRKDIDEYVQSADAWLDAAEETVSALPPAPSRETGLVRLGTLCEQGRRWRSASTSARSAGIAFGRADRLHATYQRFEAEQYQLILHKISDRVAGMYSVLHPGEGFTGVAIEPWTEKGLELALDFHGTHQRPPHGVLSESHLNSLAVALFLAMAETFNEELDLIVLDDVINSFDIEHRGRLAELLVTEFGGRQLIVLTHDHQFYQHLARRAPSWINMELASWTYDEGPRTTKYSSGRLLDAARHALTDGDIQGGAAKTRRALEEILDEACEALEASLPFRRGHANDRREIGELMSGLRSRLKVSAKAWYEQLHPDLTALEADTQAALNVEVHAGRGWASRQEAEAALSRVETLDKAFTCKSCGSRIWTKGNRDAGRCSCGASTYPPGPSMRAPRSPDPPNPFV